MSWDWTDATLDAITAYLVERRLLAKRPSPRRIGDGHSNLTFLLSDGTNGVVLRRPPPPPLPKGANDVLREASVLRALEGTGVPVPKVLAESEAGDVLDVPFYVMEYLPGLVITDVLPPHFRGREDRQALADAYVDALADLHAVDWAACGLADFGRPRGFNRRHLQRIESLLRSREDDVPKDFLTTLDWLQANIPEESGASVVHNDFRLGNVMWRPDGPPTILAILDWELATIGDPLLDVGYLALCYPQRGEPLNPTQQLSAAFLEPGFPGRDDCLDRYARRSGRDLSNLNWYIAMVAWKMAVLYDFSHRSGRDPYYEDPTQAGRFIEAADRFAGLPAARSEASG